MGTPTVITDKRYRPMKKCSPEERELCARHEATHVLFAVILDSWIRRIGIPRVTGKRPYNPLGKGHDKSHMGYVDLIQDNPGLDGFISLVGHTFEKVHGDRDRAPGDYQHAKEHIAPESFIEAEKLAESLVCQLETEITTIAGELIAKVKVNGTVEGSKLMRIEKNIQDRLGPELYNIRSQIKRCCETLQY